MGLVVLPAIPPIVEGLLWLGAALGIGHQVLPGKEGREKSIRDLGNAMAMSNAQDDAKANADSSSAAATCATGNCEIPPKCKEITEEMRRAAGVIQKRIDEMAADVFGMAGGKKIPGQGDLKGHIKAIKQAKNRLQDAVRRAKNKGCPIPSDVQQALDKEPPE
jgi:hypothetical protein